MPELSHGLEATGGANIRLVGWNGGRRRRDKAGRLRGFPSFDDGLARESSGIRTCRHGCTKLCPAGDAASIFVCCVSLGAAIGPRSTRATRVFIQSYSDFGSPFRSRIMGFGPHWSIALIDTGVTVRI